MDKRFIKALIENGTPFCNLKREVALALLNNEVMGVFIKSGVHRQMASERFNEEVKFCALQLFEEILSDAKYSRIRDNELHYIFSEGIKGRLGLDKDIVITFKSLMRWIEGYVSHFEYKEAISKFILEHQPKPVAIPSREWTDADSEQVVKETLNEYIQFRSQECERGCRSVGDILLKPISLADYGGIRRKWLMKYGYMSDGETLVQVFDRAMSNKGELVKL